ncbi:MAG: hypothetical protein O2930_01360 [Acidobacteria bacterium]|nr:hypothetical protein [Acidobacteriota bacterium]
MRSSRLRITVALAAAMTGVALATLGAQQLPEGPQALPPSPSRTLLICGTPDVMATTRGVRPLVAPSVGQPLWFTQQPSILTPDYAGAVTLSNFVVSGDVPTIRFQSAAPLNEGDIETWTRTATQLINGQLVSVLNPVWGGDALERVLRSYSFGWDKPRIEWGEVLPGETLPGGGSLIFLRLSPRNLQTSAVVQLSGDVQYSSNIVNLRIPGYGGSRLGDDQDDYDAATVAAMFYEHFEDSYDALAIVPHDDHLASYTAFHSIIKNEVSGIGQPLMDDSAAFGSTGRLKAYEVYLDGSVNDNVTSSHETAHQWGHYFDWAALTGLVRAGSQATFHSPLWATDETFMAGLLVPTRRLAVVDGAWQVVRTPRLARFHPFMRYAMGILPAGSVPEVTLFDEQGQFGGIAEPAAGTPTVGATRTATVFNVIGMLGERQGPVPTDWQRATIVVTRDRLLTQAEMDYWTFFARRIEDPFQSGVATRQGIPSFDLSTDRAIDLVTTIRPKVAAPLVSVLDVNYPALDATSWRGLTFDAPIRTSYASGERVTISGRVTATDRADFSQVVLIFSPDSGLPGEVLQTAATVSPAGTFVLSFQFEAQHIGTHALSAYLFWPGAPNQIPRGTVTPIVVAATP